MFYWYPIQLQKMAEYVSKIAIIK